jgi:hypothetical protein
MNNAPRTCPGLVSLYWRDFTIKYAVNTAAMALLLAVGIPWATQPVSPDQPPAPVFLEAALAEKVSAGFLVLAALALIVLLRRYLLISKILRHGEILRGIVDEIDVLSRRTDNHTRAIRKPVYSYTYFVVIHYGLPAMQKKVRLKLPQSAFTYGMVKGGEADLIVLASTPDKPLLREVYLGRF